MTRVCTCGPCHLQRSCSLFHAPSVGQGYRVTSLPCYSVAVWSFKACLHSHVALSPWPYLFWHALRPPCLFWHAWSLCIVLTGYSWFSFHPLPRSWGREGVNAWWSLAVGPWDSLLLGYGSSFLHGLPRVTLSALCICSQTSVHVFCLRLEAEMLHGIFYSE